MFSWDVWHVFGLILVLGGAVLTASAIAIRHSEAPEDEQSRPMVVAPAAEPAVAVQLPDHRPTSGLEIPKTAAEALLRNLQLPADLTGEVLLQAGIRAYDSENMPAAANYMASVVALIQQIKPDLVAGPENQQMIELALQKAFEVEDVRIIRPTEGGRQPFDPKKHRAFPSPTTTEGMTIATLVRCGFEVSDTIVPAWVELT